MQADEHSRSGCLLYLNFVRIIDELLLSHFCSLSKRERYIIDGNKMNSMSLLWANGVASGQIDYG